MGTSAGLALGRTDAPTLSSLTPSSALGHSGPPGGNSTLAGDREPPEATGDNLRTRALPQSPGPGLPGHGRMRREMPRRRGSALPAPSAPPAAPRPLQIPPHPREAPGGVALAPLLPLSGRGPSHHPGSAASPPRAAGAAQRGQPASPVRSPRRRGCSWGYRGARRRGAAMPGAAAAAAAGLGRREAAERAAACAAPPAAAAAAVRPGRLPAAACACTSPLPPRDIPPPAAPNRRQPPRAGSARPALPAHPCPAPAASGGGHTQDSHPRSLRGPG